MALVSAISLACMRTMTVSDEHLSQEHSVLDSGPHPKARHSLNINGHMAIHLYDFLHFFRNVRGVFPLRMGDWAVITALACSFQVVPFYLLFILYYFR
jgi:hypothetical protein